MGDYLPVMARREELRDPYALHSSAEADDSRQGQMSRYEKVDLLLSGSLNFFM